MALLLSEVAAAEQPAKAVEGNEAGQDEIVVRAVRGKCVIVRDGIALGRGDLDAFARGWPQERPVRILEPKGADYPCLADIAFKLQRKGIRHIEFVPPTVPD